MIKARLSDRLGREWLPGQRLPPLRQLADQMDVGQTNILRAVQELASEGRLESRRRRGTMVTDDPRNQPLAEGFLEPRSQAALRSGATVGRRIAVVCPEAQTEQMIVDMLEGVTTLIAECGGSAKRVHLGSRPDQQMLRDLDADGLVLINPMLTVSGEVGRPLVIVSTSEFWPAIARGYDLVTVDQQQGGLLAGEHLASHKPRNACFIGVHSDVRDRTYDQISTARLEGFARGIRLPADQIVCLKVAGYDTVEGASVMPEFLKLGSRPRAIFAASDEIAVGFIAGAAAHGLSPGRDFAIVGFDGQSLGRSIVSGPLTTVRVPAHRMGRAGARLMIDRLTDPELPVRRLHLGCMLSVGATSAATPAPRKSSRPR
jgi:DNA-binding LacI/PurR family transcriptional regulator